MVNFSVSSGDWIFSDLVIGDDRSVCAIGCRRSWLDIREECSPRDGVDAVAADQEIECVRLPGFCSDLDLLAALEVDGLDSRVDVDFCSMLLSDFDEPFVEVCSMHNPPSINVSRLLPLFGNNYSRISQIPPDIRLHLRISNLRPIPFPHI